MQVDYLIIGQGICGSFLSYYLDKNNSSFLVIDDGNKNTSSKVASGVINPITGRRLVRTWMIEEVLPFAVDAYKNIETNLNINIIEQCNVIDFHTTPQMKLAFEERLPQEVEYLSLLENEQQFDAYFNNYFGAGKINNCWLIDVNILLGNWRQKLLMQNNLIETYFNIDELIINENNVQYKNIIANKIIFCDGVAATNNKWFKQLPFAPNKGEALIVEIPNLPAKNIYKCGVTIVPWKDNLFWVGSSYEWNFENDKPTQQFKTKTENTLKQLFKIPFKTVEHLAAVRPANIERRPFIGLHPTQKNIGIFNGMGTKGCSLAPYFASEFAAHLLHQKPINPLVNVNRFEKMLSR